MTALFERFLKFFSICHYHAENFKVNQQNAVIFKKIFQIHLYIVADYGKIDMKTLLRK